MTRVWKILAIRKVTPLQTSFSWASHRAFLSVKPDHQTGWACREGEEGEGWGLSVCFDDFALLLPFRLQGSRQRLESASLRTLSSAGICI